MLYVSYLANDADYQGVLLNKYRLNKFGSSVSHACIVLNDVTDEVKSALSRDGIIVLPLDFVSILHRTGLSDEMIGHLSSSFVFGKLLIFLVTGSEKCVFLDADFLICENLDYLFDAACDDRTMYMVRDHCIGGKDMVFHVENAFNSGLIVFQPSADFFNQCLDLLRKLQGYPDIFSKLKTDQEVFNLLNQEQVITIQSLPYRLNVYPHTAPALLKSGVEESVAVYHFIGRPKPWDFMGATVLPRGFENGFAVQRNVEWLDAYLEYCKSTYLSNELINGGLSEDASVISVVRGEEVVALREAFTGHAIEGTNKTKGLEPIYFQSRLTEVQHQILDVLGSLDSVFVVQVGSNDGQQGDPLFELLRQNRAWRGLFIEPVGFLFERLKKNYANSRRFIFENKALDRESGTLEFFYVSEEAKDQFEMLPYWYDQLGSFNRDHIVKHLDGLLEPYIESEMIECDTLMNVLDVHQIGKVDLLHIDTEGHDYKIISSVDFELCRPALILYEHVHLSSEEKVAATALLSKHNYSCQQYGNDTLATLLN